MIFHVVCQNQLFGKFLSSNLIPACNFHFSASKAVCSLDCCTPAKASSSCMGKQVLKTSRPAKLPAPRGIYADLGCLLPALSPPLDFSSPCLSLAEVLLLNNQHLLEKAGGKSLLPCLADAILASYDIGCVLEVNIKTIDTLWGQRGWSPADFAGLIELYLKLRPCTYNCSRR